MGIKRAGTSYPCSSFLEVGTLLFNNTIIYYMQYAVLITKTFFVFRFLTFSWFPIKIWLSFCPKMIQSRYLPPLPSLVPFLFPPPLARAFCCGGASSPLLTHLPSTRWTISCSSKSAQDLTSHCYTLLLLPLLLLLLLTTEQPRINYGMEGGWIFLFAPHPCPQNMQEVDSHFFFDMPSKSKYVGQ